jgi:hypothetical protein
VTTHTALFSRDCDLTGLWSGEYWFSAGGPPTPFSAHLVDSAGSITGTTLEPNTFAHPGLIELGADFNGARGQLSVRLTKLYHPAPGVYREPIFYTGIVDPDFTLIDGRWVCGTSSTLIGRFVLVRVSRGVSGATVRQQAEAAPRPKLTASPGRSSRLA